MKKMKRLLTIGVAVALMFCMSLSFVGCDRECQILESDYYIYQVDYVSDDIGIIGLTAKGKEQEYLIIPETINQKKVTNIRNAMFDIEIAREKYENPKNINYDSKKLKKVFFVTSDIEIITGWLLPEIFNRSRNPSFEAWFCISNKNKSADYDFYRTSFLSLEKTANVSYYYNYENSPNDGYYWIDNYEYGERIEYIPENPLRDGYAFGGWYKESECTNIWYFERDTLPQAQYDENGKKMYQETKLYAKWIKE